MHFMIDLETLGQRAGCVVLSIGAVAFDPIRRTIDEDGFYRVISTKDCLSRELRIDADTMSWWLKQSPEARKVLDEAEDSDFPLESALLDLNKYLIEKGVGQPLMWSCGADFDLPILGECYARCEMPLPWKFWNSRCFRTLKALGNMKKCEPIRGGVYHNALDDARHQAQWALTIAQMYGFVL